MDIILNKILKILKSSLACFLVFSGVGGCQDKVASPSVGPKHGEFVSLTITGYNYTNKYIDEFFVDGNGGLNLFVSSATSGGGGSVCCVKYIIGATLWKPEIRWQVGGCTYNSRKDRYGKSFSDIHHFYKEVEAPLDVKIPGNPKYLEVHFYPDGHVETAMTELPSPPRLALSADREDKTPYQVCPQDKKPAT